MGNTKGQPERAGPLTFPRSLASPVKSGSRADTHRVIQQERGSNDTTEPMAHGVDASSLLGAVPGAIALVDETGTVVWINDQVTELSGHLPEELIGSNMLDHLDLDANPLALESVGFALETPGVRLPTVLGFRTRSGETIAVEAVANNQFGNPEIRGMVVHLRPCGERQLIDRALGSVATADPLDIVIGHLSRVVRGTTLRSEATIVLHPDGPVEPGRVIASDPKVGRLIHEGGAHPPWRQAAESGQPVLIADLAEMASPLRVSAHAKGFKACWAFPIPHIETRHSAAVLVLWRSETGLPEPSAVILANQVIRLTQLALDRHERSRQLFHAAAHDHLTGLANRARFYEVLEGYLSVPEDPVGVLYVDLDRFKEVNDEFGHGRGDRVLKAIAARLVDAVPVSATVARLGGDEFAVCMSGANEAVLTATADRLLDTLSMRITVDGDHHQVAATIGMALSPPGPDRSSDFVVDSADVALLEGKAAGKGTWRLATVAKPA